MSGQVSKCCPDSMLDRWTWSYCKDPNSRWALIGGDDSGRKSDRGAAGQGGAMVRS